MSIEYLSLNEIQQEELNMLLMFKKFCRDNSLRYSLQAGTLLGAIRHKGFIPWDDDVDVSMPRPDYNKLLSISDQLPDGYALVSPNNSSFNCPFIKIVNLGIRAQEPALDGVHDEYLWIDIFPIDGAPRDENQLKRIQRRIAIAYRKTVWCLENHSSDSFFKRTVKNVYKHLFGRIEHKSNMLEIVNEISLNPGYENSEYVSSFLGCGYNYWSVLKAEYEDMVELEFEGNTFTAMGCWDQYLTIVYGNYMVLPPVSRRQSHHYLAWKIQ